MDGISELDGLTDGELDGFVDDEGTDECFAVGSIEVEGMSEDAMDGTSELDGLTYGELDGFKDGNGANASLLAPLKWKECPPLKWKEYQKMPWTAQVKWMV